MVSGRLPYYALAVSEFAPSEVYPLGKFEVASIRGVPGALRPFSSNMDLPGENLRLGLLKIS